MMSRGRCTVYLVADFAGNLVVKRSQKVGLPMSDLVPNPRRRALQQVLDSMRRRDAGFLADALKKPDQRMGTRRVWVGGGAPVFQDNLSGRSRHLRRLVDDFLDGIHRQITAMPEMVTREEALGRWAAPPSHRS
jgi:hypothetical protein